MSLDGVERILVLGPHTDDGEFGCGGSICKLVEAGKTVYYAAFSICEESVPENLPRDILQTEIEKAAKVMGIAEPQLITFRYRVRHFPQHRQDILEDMIALRRKIQPDLVFLPNQDDIHQDHQTICQEGIRAFKFSRILGYEMPWNNLSTTTNCHIKLDESHVRQKMDAILCYQSQQVAGRGYAREDFIFGQAKTRGIQCGAEFAEAFEVIRWLID